MNGLFDFFSPEAGQRRRAALDEFGRDIGYYVPPELRGLLGLAAEMSPTATVDRAATASMRAADPSRTTSQRIGDVGNMLSEVAGVVGPAAVANRAAMPAAQALQESLMGFSAGAQDLGRTVVDRLNQPGPVPTMYSNPMPGLLSAPNINALDPNAWRSRIEQSIPKSWLDPKFDRPQWHGISNVSSNLPEQELAPVFRDTGTLLPEQTLTIDDLQGRTAIPAYGDRSVAGSDVLGVGSLVYETPFRSLGGADFMREMDTGIWANATKEASDLAAAAQSVIRDGGDPALVYTAMGPQSADFSTMMANAVMNQYNPSLIDPIAAARYDDAVRAVLPRFTSILDPNFLEGLTGSQRWNLWQLMDKAALRDAGLPNINLARRSITDLRLLDAVPFDAGLTIGRPTGGLLQLDETVQQHPTYPAQLAGSYEGGLAQNIPGKILWRDFFEGRRASGEPISADQRSFMMNADKIKQFIDQQTVDEANAFIETMRNLDDPSSPLRLWRGRLND